jgi:hypothetical protein
VIFRVTFADGSAELVNASSVGPARLDAIQHFPERIVARVAQAGLSDMMVRRRPAKLLKSAPEDPA